MRLTGPNTGIPAPHRCAACWQQHPNLVHVDFEVGYDGPTFRDENGTLITIDDLIICENCLKDAARLLRNVPDLGGRSVIDHLRERTQALEQLLYESRRTIERLRARISELEDDLVRRLTVPQPVETPPPAANAKQTVGKPRRRA